MESTFSPIASAGSPGTAPGQPVTLAELLAGMGADSVTTVGEFRPDQPVTRAELYDALEPLPAEPGTVLLVPSLGSGDPAEIVQLAQQAARHGVTALAVKCRTADQAVFAPAAASTGVAILRVADHVSWRLFDAALAQLLGGLAPHTDVHRDRGPEPLFALANELAGHFGGSVAIEDLGRRIVAYSAVPGQIIDGLRTQGILTRRVPDSPVNDDQYRTVLRAERPVVYPGQGAEEPRIAIGIHAGTLPLGTIWIIHAHGAPDLTPEQDARIRTAASVAARHMLEDARSRDAATLPRENRFRALLAGTSVTGSEFAELGLSEERGCTVLTFTPGDDASALSVAQLRSAVSRHLALSHPEAVTVIRDRRVYGLVARDSRRDPAELVGPLLPVIDRLIGPGTRVALPGDAYRAGDVAQLRQLAERLLDSAARGGSPDRIITLQVLRPHLLLERFSSVLAAEPELAAPEIDELWRTEPRVADTVLRWCGHFGNVAKTARQLGVHENTVRHRVRQAEAQYGVSLSSADDRFTAWAQLRIRFAPSASPDRNTEPPATLLPQGPPDGPVSA